MKLSLQSPLVVVALCVLVVALAILGVTQCTRDAQGAFEAEVHALVQHANSARYGVLLDSISHEMKLLIKSYGLTPEQAIASLQRFDTQDRSSYRFVRVVEFFAKNYAEVELERSEPGGKFSGKRLFRVPFSYTQGRWRIASKYRSELQNWEQVLDIYN